VISVDRDFPLLMAETRREMRRQTSPDVDVPWPTIASPDAAARHRVCGADIEHAVTTPRPAVLAWRETTRCANRALRLLELSSFQVEFGAKNAKHAKSAKGKKQE
jgi:hypothetical protein